MDNLTCGETLHDEGQFLRQCAKLILKKHCKHMPALGNHLRVMIKCVRLETYLSILAQIVVRKYGFYYLALFALFVA